MDMIYAIGRVLFSLLFLIGAWKHLVHHDAMGQYAASRGVFGGRSLSIIAGIVLLFGGLSFLTGVYVRISSILLLLFLLSTTAIVHRFWKVESPLERQYEKEHFYKNVAITGALLSYFAHGSGPLTML